MEGRYLSGIIPKVDIDTIREVEHNFSILKCGLHIMTSFQKVHMDSLGKGVP